MISMEGQDINTVYEQFHVQGHNLYRTFSTEDISSNGHYLSFLISKLGQVSICDIGCSMHPSIEHYNEDIGLLDYTALDIHENVISQLKQKYNDYWNLNFDIYDLETESLPKNYDIILLNNLFHFEEEDINELIEYHYVRTDKVLTLSLLDGTLPRDIQDELLIVQRNPMIVISYVLANFPLSVVDRALQPNKYRITIFKDQKYYDQVLGLERRHHIGES